MAEHSVEAISRLVFQLAAILIAAKLGGEICERYLKTPAVLGELAAGIIIGPFALGGVDIPGVGSLFAHVGGAGGEGNGFTIPVSEGLWSIAQVGSIILLFAAGLETNLRQFIRYAGPASLIGIGGVVLPFLFGMAITVAFGFADSFSDPIALFMGALATPTSIGISVRILSDLRRLDTPEGVTILAAAVFDDVLAVLVVTIVIGINATGVLSVPSVGLVALKTFGFWIVFTGIGILLSKHISNLLDRFRGSGAALALSLALAFFSAGLAQSFGLAMIIGAFSMGLALSGTQLADRIGEPLRGVYSALVPIFFVVIGTLVDVTSLGGVWQFGLVFAALAVISKMAGTGLPALFTGFNRHGARRIGFGMLPRVEVTLVVAGIGISQEIIGGDLLGVAIIMIMICTVIAPLMLSRSFREGVPGTRSKPPT